MHCKGTYNMSYMYVLIWLIDSDYRFDECSFPNEGNLKTFVFMARNHVDDMKFLIFATLLKSEKP